MRSALRGVAVPIALLALWQICAMAERLPHGDPRRSHHDSNFAARAAVLGPGATDDWAGALAWTVPLNETISFGQVNLVLAMACLLDCTWSGRHRGVLTGVATAVKLSGSGSVLVRAR